MQPHKYAILGGAVVHMVLLLHLFHESYSFYAGAARRDADITARFYFAKI